MFYEKKHTCYTIVKVREDFSDRLEGILRRGTTVIFCVGSGRMPQDIVEGLPMPCRYR
jgi:hypothetical protein